MGLTPLLIAAGIAVTLLFLASEIIHANSTALPGGLLAFMSSMLRHLTVAVVGVIWMWFASIIMRAVRGDDGLVADQRDVAAHGGAGDGAGGAE